MQLCADNVQYYVIISMIFVMIACYCVEPSCYLSMLFDAVSHGCMYRFSCLHIYSSRTRMSLLLHDLYCITSSTLHDQYCIIHRALHNQYLAICMCVHSDTSESLLVCFTYLHFSAWQRCTGLSTESSSNRS